MAVSHSCSGRTFSLPWDVSFGESGLVYQVRIGKLIDPAVDWQQKCGSSFWAVLSVELAVLE